MDVVGDPIFGGGCPGALLDEPPVALVVVPDELDVEGRVEVDAPLALELPEGRELLPVRELAVTEEDIALVELAAVVELRDPPDRDVSWVELDRDVEVEERELAAPSFPPASLSGSVVVVPPHPPRPTASVSVAPYLTIFSRTRTSR